MQARHDSERRAVLRRLFQASQVGLLAWATGLPPWLVQASALPTAPQLPGARHHGRATSLIAAVSQCGEPLGANAPGTYGHVDVLHPRHSAMRPELCRLGGSEAVAARPWARLPAVARAQMAVVHHQTGNVVHADALRTQAMCELPGPSATYLAWLARELAGELGTAGSEPIVLGTSDWYRFGRGRLAAAEDRERPPQGQRGQQAQPPQLLPTSIKAALGGEWGTLQSLGRERERVLKQAQAFVAASASSADVVGRCAISAEELRLRADALCHQLARIDDDGATGQLRAAVSLVALRVAPVVVVHVPFGGDNHHDENLAREATDTVASLAAIGELATDLHALGLSEQTTFATLDVFGRTLRQSHKGARGRDHNAGHQAAILLGPRVRPGIVGGIEPARADYVATTIDPSTGQRSAKETSSAGVSHRAVQATLAVACGVSARRTQAALADGVVLASALAPGVLPG